jgi:SAM-dependent methyltransferase
MSQKGLPHSLCNDCHSVFLNPAPTEAELNSFYASQKTEEAVDEIVRSGAMRVLETNRREYFEDHRVKPLLKYLHSEAKIFDVGCGVGAFVYAMKKAGLNAMGCDLSTVSVSAGREILELDEISLFQGDSYSIPKEKFDLVTLWTVIEHLLEPEAYLKYIKQNHLRDKEGFVLVEFPTTDSLMFDHLGEYFKWIMPPYHLNLFSKKGMETLLQRSGFEVVEIHSMPRNWYFFESVAKKVGLSNEKISELEK